jgi:hypothetical protein
MAKVMKTCLIMQNKSFKKSVELKGQSHEKVGEMRVEGDSLGPN